MSLPPSRGKVRMGVKCDHAFLPSGIANPNWLKPVIPAKAGIQKGVGHWRCEVPAFAGTTVTCKGTRRKSRLPQ